MMLKKQEFGRRLATTAFGLGVTGFPLWLLSYVWIGFRLTGRETDALWKFIAVSEIGAMIAGLLSIALGVISRRFVEPDGADFRTATRAIMLGATVWVFIVVFNLIGIFFFS
jgi:hypothetical protein